MKYFIALNDSSRRCGSKHPPLMLNMRHNTVTRNDRRGVGNDDVTKAQRIVGNIVSWGDHWRAGIGLAAASPYAKRDL